MMGKEHTGSDGGGGRYRSRLRNGVALLGDEGALAGFGVVELARCTACALGRSNLGRSMCVSSKAGGGMNGGLIGESTSAGNLLTGAPMFWNQKKKKKKKS